MPLLTLALLTGSLAAMFILVSLFMMLVILIQRPKGGGLSGAFGGAGGSAQAAFGAKTGDFLTWTTCILFALFLILAMGLTWSIRADIRSAQSATQPLSITPENNSQDSPATASDSAAPGSSTDPGSSPADAAPPADAGDPAAQAPADEAIEPAPVPAPIEESPAPSQP